MYDETVTVASDDEVTDGLVSLSNSNVLDMGEIVCPVFGIGDRRVCGVDWEFMNAGKSDLFESWSFIGFSYDVNSNGSYPCLKRTLRLPETGKSVVGYRRVTTVTLVQTSVGDYTRL